MTSDYELKVKKSKKEKKERQVDIDLTESSPEIESVVQTKKSKKEKKEKAQVEEAIIADELVSDEIVSEKKSKKEKKHKRELEAAVVPAVEPDEAPAKKDKKSKKEKVEEEIETPKKEKKSKTDRVSNEASVASSSYHEDNVVVNTPMASDEWVDESSGGARYWKRIDEAKYKNKVEGTKFAKISHYDKGGDAWGNDAADTLSKVKGKGFVKAMQKLKRASWKGQGSLDTGVNSVQFSDWDE